MKLKIAILEDNPSLLKDHKQNLEATDLCEVVAFATNSNDFLNNEKTNISDALLLDIDLGGGSSMNGLDVAFKLKLPVLFVSGHNAAYLKDIEKLETEFDLIVDHITKPFTEKEFLKKASKFLNEVLEAIESKFIVLDFEEDKHCKIPIDTIVYLESDTGKSGASNNKRIYFTDKKPEVLIDFSFSKMSEKGFKKNKFLTVHRSFVVNEKHIKSYKKITHEIEVEIFTSTGKKELKYLKASENFKMK
ncbi:MAG: response regulator [Bacteroidetes bacterium]|nr:response regulator [Bacteroidota bacterium]MBP9188198.1 response regulator [Chitinophagales bacterium]MBK7109365.1 response regulator [Bacteroidota bacterium]MBK8487894.1 response regulator [Bacteroidota bacterium]MBK8682352.1 response regulator [Bacteroidota bacterium]